jgi:hypothetical protein
MRDPGVESKVICSRSSEPLGSPSRWSAETQVHLVHLVHLVVSRVSGAVCFVGGGFVDRGGASLLRDVARRLAD